MPTLTAREAALARLTNFGVPMPSDWVHDLHLEPALFFLKDLAEAALAEAADNFAAMAEAGDEVDAVAAEVMNGISTALVGATHALVSLELLPQEAEDALAELEP